MSWDFETEPEFQSKLDWMATFVRDEVEPLDVLWARRHLPAADGSDVDQGGSAIAGRGALAGVVGMPSGTGARRPGLWAS